MQPDTPSLVLDLDAFERNVALMARTIVQEGGKRWRPHAKAIRSPALVRRLIEAGASGVTCSTVAEAKVMVEAGIRDVLVASQVVRPADLELLAELNRDAIVLCSVDAPAHVVGLAATAKRHGVRLPVLVEVEVGLQRAGAAPGADAVALAQAVHAQPSLQLMGFMAWEGHVTRVPDHAARPDAIRQAVRLLTGTADLAREQGLPVPIVSCGGTATFLTTSQLAGVTELQAGGGVFGDLRAREAFGVPMACALTLHATVLARPTPQRIVCDAGWKTLPFYPVAPRASGLSEVLHMAPAAEHLSLTLAHAAGQPAIGDRIVFEPGYADAITFLHRSMHAIRPSADGGTALEIPAAR